jgi:hypothetical protein
MAQRRSLARIEERGCQPSLDRQAAMANGVDAGVHPMQAPFVDPAHNLRLGYAARDQLAASHDSKLPLREFRHLNLGS